MNYTIAFISFLITLGVTPIVRWTAARKGWMAYPVKDRWHTRPTALLGGIAIYVGVILPLVWTADFQSVWAHILAGGRLHQPPSPAAVAAIGITLMFILGLLDDFINIKPHTKLIGQILVASVAVFLGLRLHWFTSLTLDTMVTILWIAGITNALNLIDNMDGLCTGVSLIASVYLAVLFGPDRPEVMVPALILAGALGAFLIYNFNPASIFMGDCGSLVIGFMLSILPLYYPQCVSNNPLSVYFVPVMVLMVPIMDTVMVTVIRTLSGRRASQGGKDHTSHRLVLMGFSEKGAVCFLYIIGAVSGVSALFVSRTDTLTSPVVIIPLIVSLILMAVYMAQLRVYPEKEFSVLRNRAYTPILLELTYKKQLLMVTLDLALISFSYYLAYRLRFSGEAFSFYFQNFLRSLPAVIGCKLVIFFAVGVYRGIWRYLSVNDVFLYIRATFWGSLLSVTAVTFIYRFEDFSKGIFIIDWLLLTALLIGTRGSFRLFIDTIRRKTLSGDSILIYGAGRGGEILLREIMNNGKLDLKPVGFIDDDVLKAGKKVQGYPILGKFSDLEMLCEKYSISGILVSFRRQEPEHYKRIQKICRKKGLFLKRFSICIEHVEL